MADRHERISRKRSSRSGSSSGPRAGCMPRAQDPARPKFYFLTMLPYPSGDLHIGHWYAMTPSDAAARYLRMRGYNVFFPIGFDAFGLPAENAAIKHGTHPYRWTMANIERMRGQLRSMGAMWAWDHEAVIVRPRVLQVDPVVLPEAVRSWAWPIASSRRWISARTCNTTLAREQVWGDDRHCERCGTPVIKKELEQWFFKITDYADELLRLSTASTGRSASARCRPTGSAAAKAPRSPSRPRPGDDIVVFTTRPDTLWGATFMVLAPEHPLVREADHRRSPGGRGRLPAPGQPPDRDRAHRGRQGEDRRLHRRVRDQPGQR